MMARAGGSRASSPSIEARFAIPRRHSEILPRPRLLNAFNDLANRRLYLVVAPPGFGKTTILVDFAAGGGMPVCWYSLGPADVERTVFLEGLIGAIQARFPRFASRTRRLFREATSPPDPSAVVTALANDVQQRLPDPVALVLDDYQEVNQRPAINAVLDDVLRQAPPNLRVVVASQTMPRLHLSHLAATHNAGGLGTRDLRFTLEEVCDLMRDVYRTAMPQRVVEQLTERSEGWITGLVLTKHTMWRGLFESMLHKAPQEEVFGELAGHILARQPHSVQRLLLASSVLDDIEPALAGALAGTSRAGGMLRRLEEGSLFVTGLTCRKPVYRCHRLFRDHLLAQLDQGAAGLSRAELERHAGELYVERGQPRRAMPHLLAGSAFDQAAAVLLEIGDDALAQGHLETLAAWIDALPEHQRSSDERFGAWRAAAAAGLERQHRATVAATKAARQSERALRRRAVLRLLPTASPA